MSQFSVGQAVIDIRADDSGLRDAEPRVRRTMERIRGYMLRAAAAASAALGAAGVFAVNAAARFEQTEIAMASMLGSAREARDLLDELSEFAARTPFQFAELAGSARLMLALGAAAEDVLPRLRALGNATSALGGNDELLRRIILAIGQMEAKSKISAEEMRQLSEAGIPGWELLARIIGEDIPTTMKMAENGAIRAATVVPRLIQAIGERFEGAMEEQSRTLIGILSNLKDQIEIQSRGIGNALIENLGIKEILTDVVALIERFGPAAVEAANGITKMIVPAATFVASLVLWSKTLPLVIAGTVRLAVVSRTVVGAIMGLRAAMLAANTATFLFYTQLGRLNIFLTGKAGWLAATAMLKLFASRAAIARAAAVALAGASAALNAVLMGSLVGGLAVVTTAFVHSRAAGISYGEALLDLAHKAGIFTTAAQRMRDVMDSATDAAERMNQAREDRSAARNIQQEIDAQNALIQAIKDRITEQRKLNDLTAQQAQQRLEELEKRREAIQEGLARFGLTEAHPESRVGIEMAELNRQIARLKDNIQNARSGGVIERLRDQLTEAQAEAQKLQQRLAQGVAGTEAQSALSRLADGIKGITDALRGVERSTDSMYERMVKGAETLHDRITGVFAGIRRQVQGQLVGLADRVFEFTRPPEDVERRDLNRDAAELSRQVRLAQLLGRLAPEAAREQLDAIQRSLEEKLAEIDTRGQMEDGPEQTQDRQRATFVGVADAFNRLQASIFKGDEQRKQTAAAEKAAKASEQTAGAANAIETMMQQAVVILAQMRERLNPSPLGI